MKDNLPLFFMTLSALAFFACYLNEKNDNYVLKASAVGRGFAEWRVDGEFKWKESP